MNIVNDIKSETSFSNILSTRKYTISETDSYKLSFSKLFVIRCYSPHTTQIANDKFELQIQDDTDYNIPLIVITRAVISLEKTVVRLYYYTVTFNNNTTSQVFFLF